MKALTTTRPASIVLALDLGSNPDLCPAVRAEDRPMLDAVARLAQMAPGPVGNLHWVQ